MQAGLKARPCLTPLALPFMPHAVDAFPHLPETTHSYATAAKNSIGQMTQLVSTSRLRVVLDSDITPT